MTLCSSQVSPVGAGEGWGQDDQNAVLTAADLIPFQDVLAADSPFTTGSAVEGGRLALDLVREFMAQEGHVRFGSVVVNEDIAAHKMGVGVHDLLRGGGLDESYSVSEGSPESLYRRPKSGPAHLNRP